MMSSIKEFSDEQLVLRYQAGDIEAFGELYRRHLPLVVFRCLSMMKNSDLAQDIAQDIMIRVMNKLMGFQSAAKFTTWLYTLAGNYCLDEIRKGQKKRYESLVESLAMTEDEDETLCQALEIDLRDRAATAALSTLAAEDYQLLMLKYRDQQSIAEISQLYGISASAVKMRLARARSRAASLFHAQLQNPFMAA